MRTSVDRFGRVLVPKEIRSRAGFRAGMELEVLSSEDGVLLRPAHRKPPVRMKDGILVFTGEIAGDVTQWLNAVREERHRQVGTLR